RTFRLNRRTRHRAVRAEHAAVAGLRLEPGAAAAAHIEKLARVGRHCLDLGRGAMRACDRRLQDHGVIGPASRLRCLMVTCKECNPATTTGARSLSCAQSRSRELAADDWVVGSAAARRTSTPIVPPSQNI